MTNYSDKTSSCRVSFFLTGECGRPRKWYADEAVEWLTYNGDPQNEGKLIHDAFREALDAALLREDGSVRFKGMLAVCLDPCHEHAHPLTMIV